MKKLSVLLIMVVILFTALSLPAAAADYTIDDFSMQLSLPDNYLIYTRNMTGSEPVFQKYNLTKAQIDDWFNQSNAYFLAYNQELTQSFYIEITEDIDTRDIFNLNYCDEQKLADILKFNQRELALLSENLSLVNSSMYGTATIPYFYYEFIFHEGMEDSPLLNYSTYYNGRSFDFYFINYDGEITAEQSQLLQNIINSVKFSVTLDKPQDTSFNKQYNIKELGLKLKINEAFDVRLSDGANDNVYLTAVAIDGTPGFITLEAWEDERSRQIFSFANLPEAELKTFAEDFTVASLQTNKVYDDYQIYTSPEINFVSFWYYSKKDDGELVRVQEIYTVYNGKVFRIIYCGMEGGLDWAHSNMLVNMVKSFDLPAAQKAPPGSLAAQYQKGSALPVMLIIIGILVVVGVYLAVRHRRQIKAQKDSELNSAAQLIEAEVAACEAEASTAREAVKADEAIKIEAAAAAATAAALVAKHLATVKSKPAELIEQEQVTAAVDDTTRVRKAKYCYKCGTALMEGAVFCHVCGTKIEKGED